MKRCRNCNEEKPFSEFWKNTIYWRSYCKSCCSLLGKARRKKCLSAWHAYFIEKHGSNPKCSICGKSLQWKSQHKGRRSVVCWDHRRGKGGLIYEIPNNWLSSRLCNADNQKTWEAEDFGILCIKCNAFLPTDPIERKTKVEKLIEYVELS